MSTEQDEFEAAFAEAAKAPKKKRRGRPSKRGVSGWEIVRLVRATQRQDPPPPLSPTAPTGKPVQTAFESVAQTLNARAERLNRKDLFTTPERVRETYYRLRGKAGEPLPGTPDIF